MPNDDTHQAEREQTDESLKVERDRANRLGSMRESAESDARSTLALERARFDAKIDAARDKLDAVPEEISRARAHEDESLRAERATADSALAEQHENRERAIAMLLTLARERTDRDLLTERARSDEALANRDDFLGIVSHDLRNLICGIAITAELTASRVSDDPAWKAAVLDARQIQKYAARMNRLVRDLQDVASMDCGRLAVAATSGDTTALIAESIESFSASAAAKRITIESQVEERAMAELDHGRMLQVMSNLLTNAIKFTPEGGRVIIARTREKGTLRFSVKDTGIGVAAEDLEAIFERFWQVGKGDRRGFGLGLYIAKCIVEAHGGAIWAESKPREGTAIFFTLPAG